MIYIQYSLVLCELKEVLDLLAKNKNHQLKGPFVDCFDCHIRPDVILIYKKEDKIIYLLRIESHSKIF